MRSTVTLALDAMRDKPEKIGALGAAILIDKIQLLTGGATSRIEHTSTETPAERAVRDLVRVRRGHVVRDGRDQLFLSPTVNGPVQLPGRDLRVRGHGQGHGDLLGRDRGLERVVPAR